MDIKLTAIRCGIAVMATVFTLAPGVAQENDGDLSSVIEDVTDTNFENAREKPANANSGAGNAVSEIAKTIGDEADPEARKAKAQSLRDVARENAPGNQGAFDAPGRPENPGASNKPEKSVTTGPQKRANKGNKGKSGNQPGRSAKKGKKN